MASGNYEAAKACFAENRNMVDAEAHTKEWNLNNGLLALSAGIEQDFAEIKDLLKKILREVQKRS